jgi:chemotaxis signal transduction protein
MNIDDLRPTARRITALLADYARDRTVAFAPHATVELVERPAITAVPGAAYFAHGLLRWQARHLPVIDLHTLLLAHASAALKPPRYALVLAWQRAASSPLEYGAIGLATPPRRLEIGDAALAAPLPTDSDLWPLIASSCLRDGERACPIIDTSRLFDADHG